MNDGDVLWHCWRWIPCSLWGQKGRGILAVVGSGFLNLLWKGSCISKVLFLGFLAFTAPRSVSIHAQEESQGCLCVAVSLS